MFIIKKINELNNERHNLDFESDNNNYFCHYKNCNNFHVFTCHRCDFIFCNLHITLKCLVNTTTIDNLGKKYKELKKLNLCHNCILNYDIEKNIDV